MPILDNVLTKSEKISRDRYFDTGRISLAEVMDTRDPEGNGRLKVWIVTSGVPREDKTRWIIAKKAVSKFGYSQFTASPNEPSFQNSPTSFGEQKGIPVPGNYVFVFFPLMTGENVNAYWFACPVDPNLSSMIPGIPTDYSSDKTVKTEINPKNPNNGSVRKQGTFKPLQDAITKQGLQNDKLRGYSVSGSSRESPSFVDGTLSFFGHQFIIDDGWSESDIRQDWDSDPDGYKMMEGTTTFDKKNWSSKLVEGGTPLTRYNSGFRFRTRNGTQILISDAGQIYLINSDGSAWVELSDDGYIDCYSKSGVSASTDGDINLYAKKDINIQAGGKIRLKSGGDTTFESAGKTIVKTNELNVSSIINTKEINSNTGNIGTFISQGAQINGVFQGTLNGTAFFATSAGLVPTPQPVPTTPPPIILPVKVDADNNVDGQVGGSKTKTIATRVPTAEPYAGHDKNKCIPDISVTKKPKKVSVNKQGGTSKSNRV